MYIKVNGIEYEVEYEYEDGNYFPTSINGINVCWMDLDNPELKKWYDPLYDELQYRVKQAEIDEEGDRQADMAREDKI